MIGLLASPLARWAGVAAVVGALGLALYVQTLRLDAAGLRAATAEERAKAAAAEIERMAADRKRADAIAADAAAALARLSGVTRETIREIVAAPAGAACADSAAIRAAVQGVGRMVAGK